MPDPLPIPDAVIFDVDGLLVDTETADFEAWSELYGMLGLGLTIEEYAWSAGMYGSWERQYERLATLSGRSAVELAQWRTPRFRSRVEQQLQPAPELLSLLGELDEAGVRIGIASSSDRDWVEYLLEGMAIRDRFAVVVTGDDVARRKPAPDGYEQATARLGVKPRRSVALEDSAHGIAAARSAGLRVVTIPNAVSAFQDLSGAHHRVAGFAEVNLGLLGELLRESGGP